MSKLTYNSENKRIATATTNGVAVIPSEDTENERIVILSGGEIEPTPTPEFVLDSDGYYTIFNEQITEEYINPETLGLSIDSEGYALIGV